MTLSRPHSISSNMFDIPNFSQRNCTTFFTLPANQHTTIFAFQKKLIINSLNISETFLWLYRTAARIGRKSALCADSQSWVTTG